LLIFKCVKGYTINTVNGLMIWDIRQQLRVYTINTVNGLMIWAVRWRLRVTPSTRWMV